MTEQQSKIEWQNSRIAEQQNSSPSISGVLQEA